MARLSREKKVYEYKPLNGGGWLPKWKRLAIYIRDSFRCQYCGRDLRAGSPNDITLDHLRCRVSGGKNEATNLITACRSCNSARQDKPWRSYATGGAVENIVNAVRRKINEPLAKAILKGTAGDPRLEALR